MLRIATWTLGIAFCVGCTTVPPAAVVTRIGTYELADKTIVSDPNGPRLVSLKTEVERTRTIVIPREETHAIYGRVGFSFGVEYAVPTESQGGLRAVVTAPSPGVRDPRTGKFLRSFDFKPSCADTRCTAIYNFEHESELVPGTWAIELWAKKERLFAHEFELKQ